jgi:hypothetical protein
MAYRAQFRREDFETKDEHTWFSARNIKDSLSKFSWKT